MDHTKRPLGRAELEGLVRRLGVRPRDLLRKRHRAYRELGLDRPDVSDDEVLDAIAREPELLQRPIAVRGERAVVGRPPEKVKELLDRRKA